MTAETALLGRLDPSFWKDKRVLLTGHTGFKGGWLALWLSKMGAHVTGYALAPATIPSLFEQMKLYNDMTHIEADICDRERLIAAVNAADPDVVLHLAAQAIVSEGYSDPLGTFEANIMGTAYLLEACRAIGRYVPVVIISSDKCYLNTDTGRAFKADDPLGGYDPYSASKAGTEIVTAAYRQSFFADVSMPAIASARAGNVVGGGDWSLNRLLPDCARAFLQNQPVILRNALATRPWQHVLEPIYGYLVLAQALSVDRAFATAWNFGPDQRNHCNVGQIAEAFRDAWGGNATLEISTAQQDWHEAKTLDLDCSQTRSDLNWVPCLGLDETVEWSAHWYKNTTANPEQTRELSLNQIEQYEAMQAKTHG
jgi:CDP-glucose 4,6-dehydratase